MPGDAAWSRAEARYLEPPDAPECPECGDYIEEDADGAVCVNAACSWRVDRPEPDDSYDEPGDDRWEPTEGAP